MSNEADKKYILSIRCSELKVTIPGAEKRNCMRCGEAVWVSPSLKNIKVDGVICGHCITEKEMKEFNFTLQPELKEGFIGWKAERNYGFAM